MQGTVLKFQPETNTGLISGHDGIRYQFTRLEWTSTTEPREGQAVDFEIDDKNAKQIIVLKRAKSGKSKSKTTAIILALLLGGLGAHKFYLGKPLLGIVYILFCWTFIPAIIAFIELIIYACTSDDDFEAKYS
jgi:TM2 domain-containing membrane protein YozV/cold shock CspA family protein